MKVDLSSQIYSLPIKNPLVVGSSGITATAEKVKKVADAGAGAVVMKSIFEEEINLQFMDEMHKLEVHDANLEFLDYYDYELRKNALDAYCEEIKKAKALVNIPVIASISCSTSGEWINFAKPLEEAGADALEINAMFLPIDMDKSASDYEKLFIELTQKLKSELSIPVGIKISPYFSHLPRFAAEISKNVAGITLFNRFYNPDINIDESKLTAGPVFSTQGDYYNTLRWTALLSKVVKVPLSATTGIHTPETMIKMLMAGATSTQIVSALYLHGIKHINLMLKKLDDFMQQKGYKTLNDLVGKVPSDNKDQNTYQRVQFMKYFGSGSSMIDI